MAGPLVSQGTGAVGGKPRGHFSQFANATAQVSGRPITFLIAVLVVVVWGISGPIFNYSDTWQLVINTGTTIITFLMVFLIQNAQNRDAQAFHLKLDELIIALKNARKEVVEAEEFDDEDLKKRLEQAKQRAKSEQS